jgi:hypothetical protein
LLFDPLSERKKEGMKEYRRKRERKTRARRRTRGIKTCECYDMNALAYNLEAPPPDERDYYVSFYSMPMPSSSSSPPQPLTAGSSSFRVCILEVLAAVLLVVV